MPADPTHQPFQGLRRARFPSTVQMMEGEADRSEAGQATRQRWRRVIHFPLVTLAIAILIYFAGMTAAVVVNQVIVPPIPLLTKTMRIDVIAVVILVVLYKLTIRHLGTDRRDDLRLAGAGKPLALGLLAGLLLFSLIVAAAATLGVYRIAGEGNSKELLAAVITSAIFPAVSEELLFRGILFRWIEEFGGSWVALILTSIFFGAVHLANPDASAIAALGIAVGGGLMLGAAYMLTRSLWLPMGIHAAWNFAQGEIYDIPVSGSAVHGLVDARLTGPPLLTGNGFGLEASV
ncbi:MAG: protease family protein, partial [Sphingomonadales bacterium]|nr:protease family protein [Sphingomonadales bacterium]